MEKIAEKAKRMWGGNTNMTGIFQEIDSQFESLRMENQAQHLNVQALTQEIQDLKGRDVAPETNLRREIVKEAKELFDNRLGWSEDRNPYAPKELWLKLGIALYGENSYQVRDLKNFSKEEPQGVLPPEQWERGDFVSYTSTAKEHKRIWGVFHHREANFVWGYWQYYDGNFKTHLCLMPTSEVTFEFRPEK